MALTIPLFGVAGGSGLFPGQSNGSIDLINSDINNGYITSSDVSANDGSEVLFNLLQHFSDVVTLNGTEKITTSRSTQISGNELIKNFNFSVRTAITGDVLDVVDEADDA